MHTLRCKAPCPQLRGFVRAYAEREIRNINDTLYQPIPARLEQTLEFQLGESFEGLSANGRRLTVPPIAAIGAWIEAGFSILLKNNVLSFGIFFQPDGLSRLFRLPIDKLSRRVFDATDLFGSMMTSLYCDLGECASFAERVSVAEKFLLARAKQAESDMPDAIENAAARMFIMHGVVRVADVAHDAGLSLRQFQRRFFAKCGFSPKTFARVARFQAALDVKILSPKVRWLDVAHDLGYHDQMHMVHDFHAFAHAAPGKILASIGDARPPAMAEFNSL